MKYLRLLVLLSFGSPALYVGSYLLTVEAAVERAAVADHRVPHYCVGGKVAERLYAPLHRLDTQIRAKFWHGS